MSGPPIRVLLVDDHAVVRAGYRHLLAVDGRIEVVGEAADAQAAYAAFCALAPDVAVMDIALSGASGIEALRRIIAREPGARVLAFNLYEDAIFTSRALAAGASGYLTKSSGPETLAQAVLAVARGERYVSGDVAKDARPGCTGGAGRGRGGAFRTRVRGAAPARARRDAGADRRAVESQREGDRQLPVVDPAEARREQQHPVAAEGGADEARGGRCASSARGRCGVRSL